MRPSTKMALRCALLGVLAVVSVHAVPGAGKTPIDADLAEKIAELQAQKAEAVAAEDYDKAKDLKDKIDLLKKPTEPVDPEAQRKERLQVVRKGIADVRDKNHDGDTHKFFDHLDGDDDEHLNDDELMTILGADPDPKKRKKREEGGMFNHIMDSMVNGMKKTMDADGDGKLTKAEFHALLHPDEV